MDKKNTNHNVFKEIGFEQTEAANLKIRANLLIQLREYIKSHNLKQIEAAERLGVTQPDISAIMNGKIQYFTIDKLVNLLAKLGFKLKIESNSRRRTFSVIEGGKNSHLETKRNDQDWDILEA